MVIKDHGSLKNYKTPLTQPDSTQCIAVMYAASSLFVPCAADFRSHTQPHSLNAHHKQGYILPSRHADDENKWNVVAPFPIAEDE